MVAQTPESDIFGKRRRARDGDKRVNQHATRNPDVGIVSSAAGILTLVFRDARY